MRARAVSFAVVPMVLVCLFGIIVLHPVLGAGFFGDDLDFSRTGREMLGDPGLAFVGPQHFYRPAIAWLFAIGWMVCDDWAPGYHAATLLLHLGCVLLLGCLFRRFAIGPWAAAGGAAVWMISPYVFGPVLFVCIGFENLTVLLIWLGVACLWPGPGQQWRRSRLIGAAALVAFSVFCKESWVVIAGLVVVFELCLAGAGMRRAARVGAWVAVPVCCYVVGYAWLFPERGGYFELGPHMLSKIPHLWACFSFVERLEPARPGFGLAEVVGLAVLAGVIGLAWWRRSRLIWFGVLWFGLTLAPVLPIAYIPTRFTTVPLVGFLLAMAGVFRELLELCPERLLRVARAAVVALVGCAIAVNLIWLRGELLDMEYRTQVYQALYGEAQKLAPLLPADQPLVCVRLEDRSPLHRLQAEGYAGLEKIEFVRADAPYGLVFWPSLLTYCRCGHGDELFADAGAREYGRKDFAVVAHVVGGFRILEPSASTLGEELEHWRQKGLYARAVVPAS